MNTRILIIRTVIMFAALAAAGVAVAASAEFVMAQFQQNVMIAIGSAIFGAALTFFLIRLSSIVEK